MATVHEMLYEVDDFSTVNCDIYLHNLALGIISETNGLIDLKIDIPDIDFNISTAIPFGLMLNEIITNSVKHGIKNKNPIEIYINLIQKDDDKYILHVGDTGVGFSEEEVDYSKSLGLTLIKTFVAQLKGTIERDTTKKGVHYVIEFSKKLK